VKIVGLSAGFFLAAAVASASAAALPVLDARPAIVFSESRAKDLLQQCSRYTPQHVQGFWKPNAAQIKELEARLPAALARAWPAWADRLKPFKIGRQYGGLIVSGRKVIYVNGYQAEVSDFDGSDIAYWSKDSKNRAVAVCDGGPTFFGAVYDPEERTFRDFSFNGVA
jgi:hypothetical protein